VSFGNIWITEGEDEDDEKKKRYAESHISTEALDEEFSRIFDVASVAAMASARETPLVEEEWKAKLDQQIRDKTYANRIGEVQFAAWKRKEAKRPMAPSEPRVQAKLSSARCMHTFVETLNDATIF